MCFGILAFAAGAATAFGAVSRAARFNMATLIDFDDPVRLALWLKRGTPGRRMSYYGLFGDRAHQNFSN